MKVKTAGLIEPALSYIVSVALGHAPEKDFHSHGMTWNGWWETAAYIDTKPNEYRRIPRYSADWSQGGPIIEREKIGVRYIGHSIEGEIWDASINDEEIEGPTPLVAAMRCYVASKLGEEVDVPEELLK